MRVAQCLDLDLVRRASSRASRYFTTNPAMPSFASHFADEVSFVVDRKVLVAAAREEEYRGAGGGSLGQVRSVIDGLWMVAMRRMPVVALTEGFGRGLAFGTGRAIGPEQDLRRIGGGQGGGGERSSDGSLKSIA